MGQKKHPFSVAVTKAAGAGSNDIQIGKVFPGRFMCCQRVTVENETSGFTDLRILRKSQEGEHLYEEQDNGLAATLYWTTEPIYLEEEEYLVARLTGCTASDVLKLYVSGWWRLE